MKKICSSLLLVVLVLLVTAIFAVAEDASFRVQMPNAKGKEIKSVLTFNDGDKTIAIRPVKGDAVSIPYAQIDKISSEYKEERHITLNESKEHWLQIDYREADAHKTLMVLLDKHNYTAVLEAVKAHTGIDAEIVGNIDKRHKKM